MKGYKKLQFFRPEKGSKGTLTVIEKEKMLPFEVRRIYYIAEAPSCQVRGHHAHRALKRILFCPIGSCDLILDDGTERITIHINRSDEGIYIYEPLWLEFTGFSSDCVVVSLASEEYDESDYIRDYGEFLKFVGRKP